MTLSAGTRLARVLLLALLAGGAAPGPGGPAPSPGRIVADLRGADAPGLWDYAAIDPDAARLLVARMSGVEAFDLAGDRPGREVAAGRHVHAVVPLPRHRLLFTNGDTDTATIVEAGSGRVVATLPTGAKPDGAIYDPAAGQVLVMDGKDGTVTRIDVAAATPKVAGRIAVGGALEAPALDAGGGRLFVNIEDRAQIAVVGLASGRVTARYRLAGCDAPTGLAYDGRHRLLVAACANGVASVLREDGTGVATLPIGPHPDAVLADAAHDRMFIPSGGNGTVAEIALSPAPHVARLFTTRHGARTGAYDPRSQWLYLPYGEVTRPGGQPALVPASFGILVIDTH